MSLRTDALEVRYGDHLAVRSATIELAAGEFIGLIGPNGAGKSSLLRALAGVGSATGEVFWEEHRLRDLSDAARARAIAYLPQSPHADWPLTVRELVALGRLPHRRYGERLQDLDQLAIEKAMRETDIEHLADRPVDQLSGGEHMRAHLARAFAVDAPVLLVDEPIASLDPFHQLGVIELLARQRAAGRLVVGVLHDLNLALSACSRLLLLDDGQIVVDGAPDEAIDAGRLERHYRIRAWLTEHEGRRVAVPWQRIEQDD
jgi:iron complex transport system ATP-binding protein